MLKLGHVWQLCKKIPTGSCDCGAQNVRDIWRIWSSGCYGICITQYAHAPEGVTIWDERPMWRLLILKCQRLSWFLSLFSPQLTAFCTCSFFLFASVAIGLLVLFLQYRLGLKQINKERCQTFQMTVHKVLSSKMTYTQIILVPLVSTITFPSCGYKHNQTQQPKKAFKSGLKLHTLPFVSG